MDRNGSSSGSSSSKVKHEKTKEEEKEPIDAVRTFSLENILWNKQDYCCEYYCCMLEQPKIFIDYTTLDTDGGKYCFFSKKILKHTIYTSFYSYSFG